jgi:hypothetical protein
MSTEVSPANDRYFAGSALADQMAVEPNAIFALDLAIKSSESPF